MKKLYSVILLAISTVLSVSKIESSLLNKQLLKYANKGNTRAIKLLIKLGADVNTKNIINGNTPLHRAAYEGHRNTTQFLINHGADVNAKDIFERTPIHKTTINGYIDTTKLLIEHGADVNAKDIFERTPLYKAAFKGNIDILKLLIKHGADANTKDTINGDTPLHIATYNGYIKFIKLLINLNVNVNTENKTGSTPLHIATDNNHTKLIKLLVNSGANIRVVNNAGFTPLHNAVYKNYSNATMSLITAPIIFNNKSIFLKNNKKILKKFDTNSSNYAKKMFHKLKQLEAIDSNIIELILSYILPTDYLIEINDISSFNNLLEPNYMQIFCEQYNTNPTEAINFFKIKHVEKFALQCYMQPELGLSKAFFNTLYKQHLYTLKHYISIKNNVEQTALDVPSADPKQSHNQKKIIKRFNKINNAKEYDELEKKLKNLTEENYKKRIYPAAH